MRQASAIATLKPKCKSLYTQQIKSTTSKKYLPTVRLVPTYLNNFQIQGILLILIFAT